MSNYVSLFIRMYSPIHALYSMVFYLIHFQLNTPVIIMTWSVYSVKYTGGDWAMNVVIVVRPIYIYVVWIHRKHNGSHLCNPQQCYTGGLYYVYVSLRHNSPSIFHEASHTTPVFRAELSGRVKLSARGITIELSRRIQHDNFISMARQKACTF